MNFTGDVFVDKISAISEFSNAFCFKTHIEKQVNQSIEKHNWNRESH